MIKTVLEGFVSGGFLKRLWYADMLKKRLHWKVDWIWPRNIDLLKHWIGKHILKWFRDKFWCEINMEHAMVKCMLWCCGNNGVEIELWNWEVDCAIQFLLCDGKKYRMTIKIRMGLKVKNPGFPMGCDGGCKGTIAADETQKSNGGGS